MKVSYSTWLVLFTCVTHLYNCLPATYAIFYLYWVAIETRNRKVIWEEPRRHPSRQRITTPQSPHCLQWDAPHLPLKLPLLLRRSQPVTPIHRPTPFTTQTASRSNQPFCLSTVSRPTDGIDDKSVPTQTPAYAPLIVKRRGKYCIMVSRCNCIALLCAPSTIHVCLNVC